MKKAFNVLILLLTITGLSSCITSKDTNLMQDIPKDYSTIPPPEEYRIIPGDILSVVVYVSEDPLTQELYRGYTPYLVASREGEVGTWGVGVSEEGTQASPPIVVYSDGTINFPHIGRIFVQDLTLLETRNLLTDRIKEISRGAIANVTLRNGFFSVLGESGARRVDMRTNNMTIYQALATAGTISDYSERNKVNIIRQTKDGSIVKTFDLRSKDIMNTEFYYIQPNDVIYFPQSSGKFFGATNSFLGIFGLGTSFISIIVMALKLF